MSDFAVMPWVAMVAILVVFGVLFRIEVRTLRRKEQEAFARLDDLVENTEVFESWMCESKRLLLHEGALYRFRYDPECASCMALKREYDEGFGSRGLAPESPNGREGSGAEPLPEALRPDDKDTTEKHS